MVRLNIPKRNDPFARIALLSLFALALWSNLVQWPSDSGAAPASPSLIFAAPASVPTPALPTPALLPTPAGELGMVLAVATPTPEQVEQGWIDQGLTSLGAAADQFAADQQAALEAEQAAALQAQQAQQAADQAQYLAIVGAQAQHSPRGDVQHLPESQTGPIEQPSGVIIVPAGASLDPTPAPAAPAFAVAQPTIAPDQAQAIGARQSNSCPAGQIFYPRTGCHTPGSGGPMPGAVGEQP